METYDTTTPWPMRIIIGFTIVLTTALLALTDDIFIAIGPALAGFVAVAVWRMPVRFIAHGMLFVALLVDNPTERPGRGLYKSPLYYPGGFFYHPLEKTLHMPGLKVTGLELIILLLSAIILLRILVGDKVDGAKRTQAAAPLMKACVVSMATLAFLWIYGAARGGSINHAILQMRTMFFMPFLTVFFAYAFKSRRDIKVLLTTYVVVGVLRAFECIYYFVTFMRLQAETGGQEGDGSYVTTHSDSILAAVVVVIGMVAIYQKPTARSFLFNLIVTPIVALGIIMNNRRIAFVAVALGFFFSYLAANTAFRSRVRATVLALLPLMLLYAAAGWNAKGSWAKPVQSLKSVVQQKDTSSATRDIENNNLLATLKQNPVNGTGFGHQYLELVHAFDISAIFEAYRYVPHNSILWFWGVGGVIGYTLYWLFLAIGVFMAARVLRFAESNYQRIMAMAAISAVLAYSSQCFGDMGLMSWMGALVVSSALGMVASLATKIGAWSNTPPKKMIGERRPLVTAQSQQAAAARGAGVV